MATDLDFTPPHHFPASRKAAETAKYDPAVHRPFQFLHPWERKAAELFVLANRDPGLAATLPRAPVRKYSALVSGLFRQWWTEHYGCALGSKSTKNLTANPAWRHYVLLLETETKDAVLERLKADAVEVAEDYVWSRRAAKAAGDYKETRLAAGDHLDRIGATEKPQPAAAPQTVIVVKSATFEATNLLRELPAPAVEEIVVEPEETA